MQLSANDKIKLTEWIDAGLKVLEEIEVLRQGLRETTKGLAESLDISPKVLNKSLRAAYKKSLADEQDTLSSVEEILQATGQ